MKKISAVFFVILVIITAFCSCTGETPETTAAETTSAVTSVNESTSAKKIAESATVTVDMLSSVEGTDYSALKQYLSQYTITAYYKNGKFLYAQVAITYLKDTDESMVKIIKSTFDAAYSDSVEKNNTLIYVVSKIEDICDFDDVDVASWTSDELKTYYENAGFKVTAE